MEVFSQGGDTFAIIIPRLRRVVRWMDPGVQIRLRSRGKDLSLEVPEPMELREQISTRFHVRYFTYIGLVAAITFNHSNRSSYSRGSKVSIFTSNGLVGGISLSVGIISLSRSYALRDSTSGTSLL